MDGISSYSNFVALHKPQLVLSGVPELYWPALCKKIKDQIFDSGSSFQLVQVDYEDTVKKPYDPSWMLIAVADIRQDDPTKIFLVDHAWTFKANVVKNNLRNVPGLLDRMRNLLLIDPTLGTEDAIEMVSKQIWKYAQTYAIGGDNLSVEERVPVWYILDEVGSGLTHSDSPNFRAVPFIHIPDQMTYTLLYPVSNVEEGDVITRNFVEGNYENEEQRNAMLIPWKHYDSFYDSFKQEEPGVNYFIEGHIVESLPNLEILKSRVKPVGKVKVFSEYRYINDYLTSDKFEIVDNEDEAQVLWYLNHFKSFKELSEASPQKFVNQFPFEYVITIKDLLAIVARRCSDNSHSSTDLETSPPWLPTTFNLKTELSKLVAYFMQRSDAGLDNHWICKPYNLARGLDTYITDNLDFLCRLPLTGPKVAQKYIENPVLFERPEVGQVKFDIRYVLLLKSVSPTEVYVYNNFFLRFSNKAFALNNFEDYEQHFTVMNYAEGVTLHRMLCADFKKEWDKQYSDYSWESVESSILKMVGELFSAATSVEAPCGIAQSPQSRALYAADIMLAWEKKDRDTVIQPKLLEVNWMPDCKRACEYYPDFYNDIFSLLFLDENVPTCTKVL